MKETQHQLKIGACALSAFITLYDKLLKQIGVNVFPLMLEYEINQNLLLRSKNVMMV